MGILDIRATVTGSGTWVVASHHEAEIRINSASTSFTGDVLVYSGELCVRENFSTTGDLTIYDDATAGFPRILVRQGKVAKFNY